jgi:heavy metal sensor kinase
MASLLFLPVALAVAGYAGYLLARQALAPLGEMARRAGKITSEKLSERLPVENPEDEIGQLAQVFNLTLGRLEQAFVQLRRFTSDASHELRTPLAAMRSVGEVGLQKEASPEEYRDVIGSMLEEVNRLNRLVDSLLVLSRADAGAIQFHTAAFPVLEVARECAVLLQVLMDEKRQKLVVEGDADAMVEADRLFLRQALVNILHNAVRYSPVGSRISIRVRREADEVVLEVADNGPGITPEHAGKVFDRFYRIDQSRSREGGGAGLGLSIAQWAVEEHGGTIALDSQPGSGSTFQIRLPAKPVAVSA